METITVAMQRTEPQKQISTPPFAYLREIFVTNFGWSVVKVLTASFFINSKQTVLSKLFTVPIEITSNAIFPYFPGLYEFSWG